MESPIKYPLVNGVTFTEQSLHDTIPVLNFDMNTFYDAELISGSASNYSIPGESALDWILQQVAPILAYDAGYDIMPMIYDWIDFGDVTGSVTFSDGNFSAMTTMKTRSSSPTTWNSSRGYSSISSRTRLSTFQVLSPLTSPRSSPTA